MTLEIAFNTFKEATRQKLLAAVALAAIALLAASRSLLKLDLGHDQLRFIFDFSSGALDFFGAIIAVVSTCSLFASEIENRTVITMLSKAIGAREFVVGKWAGAAMALAVFAAAIAAVSAAMLALTEASLAPLAAEGAVPPSVNYAGLAAYFALQWLKLCMCAAAAAVICCASRSFLFSVSMSFLCVIAASMASALAAMDSPENFAMRAAAFILPDFHFMNAAQEYVFGALSLSGAACLAGYAAVYTAVCLCAGTLIFSRRDF